LSIELVEEVDVRYALLLAAAVLLIAHPASSDQKQPEPVAVGVTLAERKPIAKSADFVGRVDAINRVEIRARVTGFLESVDFKEGDMVKEGDALFRIEKGLFQAAVDQAEGALVRSKGAKVLSEIQLDRAEELLGKKVGTVVARDQARAADQQADGAILSDQANLATAKINLGYTDILSPIIGKIGRTAVTKGNVVSPDMGPLAMIVSQDPMYVTFPVSQREFLRIQRERGQVDASAAKAALRFSDGRTYDQQGTINFIDVTVNRSTDTVLVRATFANPSGLLIDGQLVRVDVSGKHPEDKVVVPQAALIADQQGVYVMVVEDGKAVVKRVKPGGEIGTGVVIEEGLAGGEQVIVEGIQAVRPGAPVQATPLPQIPTRS
jgi:membrane fusion protein, multidrug efflux system